MCDLAKLWKDGKLIHTEELNRCARTILYTLPPKQLPSAYEAFSRSSLPAEVLMDRYNPMYDDLFPLVDVEVEEYDAGERTDYGRRYNYARTTIKQYRQR